MAEQSLARRRQDLSPRRQNEAPVRVFALGMGAGVLSPPQPSGFGALITTRTGALTVRTRHAATTVTMNYGAWIPDGTDYALALRSRCDLRIVFANAEHLRAWPARALEITPLLREAVERAVAVGYLDPANERHARVSKIIDDEIVAAGTAPGAITCALPSDPTIRPFVDAALQNGDLPSIAELAARANISLRTFERRFAAETGTTPRAWLRNVRLAHARTALAAGASVTEAALAGGYASLSAFIAAFGSAYGTTPGRASLTP